MYNYSLYDLKHCEFVLNFIGIKCVKYCVKYMMQPPRLASYSVSHTTNACPSVLR